MITGRQIRAARGLLEWKAEDLARKTGLTRVTISKIEAAIVVPQEKTIKSIMEAFDKNGVDFTENEGVCIRRNEVRFFNGKTEFRLLLDHIYAAVKDGGRYYQFTGGNRYLSYADDYVNLHIERMKEVENLDARVLTLDGDMDFVADYCIFRWLDKSYGAMAPFAVYGDYVVQPVHEASFKKELVLIRSKLMAERYFEQFNFLWGKASAPPKKKIKGKGVF